MKFTTDHQWVDDDGETCLIGYTDFAQKRFGEVVLVELPGLEKTFEKSDAIGNLESVQITMDILTPVSGEVLELNKELADNPELIKNDPLGEGWLAKIKVSNPSEVDDYMDREAYMKYLESLEDS